MNRSPAGSAKLSKAYPIALGLYVLAILAAVLIGVGLWVLSFNWTHVHTSQQLAKSAAVIDGRVISNSRQQLSKGGQSLTLVVEYTPDNHPPIIKEFAVDGDAYTLALATGTAKVTYLPRDPRISRVTEFASLPFQIGIGLGGLMLLSGLYCLWHLLKTGTKTPPARQPG
jgi:hypothetical protein